MEELILDLKKKIIEALNLEEMTPGQSLEAEVRGTLCQRIDAGSDRMLLSCCRLSAEGKEIFKSIRTIAEYVSSHRTK